MESLKPIWLVDDSVLDTELTIISLQERGLANSVILMRDGAEVIERLQSLHATNGEKGEEEPVVILLDMKMPKMSGMEVLRTIKESSRFKHLPVVMFTSHSQKSEVARCYALGADGFAEKPMGFSAFVEVVSAVGKYWAVVDQHPDAVARKIVVEAAAGEPLIFSLSGKGKSA